MQVTAQRRDGPDVTVEFPKLDVENLAGLVENFQENIVFSYAKRAVVVALQGFMRTQMDAKKTPEEIQEAVNSWKPGERKPAKSNQEKVHDLLNALSPAERQALLKEYRSKGGSQQTAAA